MNELIDKAKARIHDNDLAWEASHSEEIEDELEELGFDPGFVVESMGECGNEKLKGLGAAVAKKNKPLAEKIFGLSIYPAMRAYFETQASHNAKENWEIQQMFDTVPRDENETLTRAQRTPDLLK